MFGRYIAMNYLCQTFSNDAGLNQLTAARQNDRNMTKLTPAQKRVIKAMREGSVLFNRHERPGCAWDGRYAYIGGERINTKTVDAIDAAGLIGRPDKTKHIYTLTALGREIEL